MTVALESITSCSTLSARSPLPAHLLLIDLVELHRRSVSWNLEGRGG